MTYDEAKGILNQNPGRHAREINKHIESDNITMAIFYVQSQTGCEPEIAAKIVDELVQIGKKYSNPYAKPTVECPYCHSKDTKKISGTSRFVSVGILGLASSKAGGKQWHCSRCKSDF